MEIYLPNMEMPTSCAFCRFCEGLADTLKGTCAFCMVDGKYRDAQTNDGCPLVPVPPHGRLIDADALLSQYKGNIWTAQIDYAEGLRDVAKDIADAPTIIPADKEGE